MMTATDAAAWWGAVIATLVFAWDFYKWMNRGASVVVTVSPNMESFGAMPSALDGKTYVVVEVKNLGDGSCTITHLIGVHYSSWFNKLRRKQTKSIYVGNPRGDEDSSCAASR
jgi:hypothetical protein